MIVSIVEYGLLALGTYLALGGLAAVALHVKGLRKIDPAVVGAGWFFRVLVTPGLIALWPLMLLRWSRSAGDPGPAVAAARPTAEGLRHRHRLLVQGLAVLLPLVAGAALLTRPAEEAGDSSSSLRELGQPAALGSVLVELAEPVPGLALDARVRGTGSKRQLELIVHDDLESPSVAVYWSGGSTDPTPSESTFLGIAWGPATRRYALPLRAGAGGRILLHSLGHAEMIGSFSLPATSSAGGA